MPTIWRYLDAWLRPLAVLAAALTLGFLLQRHALIWDWSRGRLASLSTPSRAVLERLQGPLEVVAYASPDPTLRQDIAGMLERYQRVKTDLSLRFIDPRQNPAAMRQLGVHVDGMLILHYQGREQRVEDQLSERSISNALERLARGGERILAFVTGDGERTADGQRNDDLSLFVRPLEARGLRALPLNFSQVTAVPAHTDLVVLASPAAPLNSKAVHALSDYLTRGGNLLWLTEPHTSSLGLAPLAEALGVRVLPGELIDGAGSALNIDDPRLIPQGSYPMHAITRGFTLTALFPAIAALATHTPSNWTSTPFLRSSAQSWTSLKPIRDDAPSTIRFDAAAGELRGPLDFGYALARPSPSPDKREQRAVVIGGGSFLANTYLGNGGNRALGERIVDWLLGDDVLIDLPPRTTPDRLLALSQRTLNALSYGFLFGLPLLLLGTGGGLLWWRRR